MFIYLLTHEKELLKKTGTGKIVNEVMENCSVIKWKRKEPHQILEKELNPNNTILVYPSDTEPGYSGDLSEIENFILLDGTWQEAKKMYNRSPYLKRFKHYSFPSDIKSNYILRRNQKDFGLCTVESVIELCRLKGDIYMEDKLSCLFDNFNNKKAQPHNSEVGL